MEPLTGDDPDQIAGYRLRARLGAGGMGRVYLAFTAGGRPVALKVIRPELGDDRDFRDRFRQEVEAARRVHGLYTAQVLDADPAATPPWLVTAYVPGPSLQEAVSAHGPLPVDTVLLLMAGVAEALQAIHAAGVVHRDLKPSNVLLAADGPRVIDFGIARAIEATTVTRTGMRVGSPPFMAPEQVEGLLVSPATDVFALGSAVAYAALGRLPFGAGNEHAMLYRVVHQAPDLDGCPEPLRALIARCLAKTPGAGRIIRKPLVAALAVAAVAGVGAAAGVLLSSGGASSSPGNGSSRNNGAAGTATTSQPASTASAAGTLRQATTSPQPKTSPPPNPAACVTGTWKSVNQQLISNINGQPTVFTGSGAVSTFLADGTITTTYSNEVFRATVDGVQWTEVLRGTAAGHWAVDNGDILYSAITSDGTEILYADGIYNNSGPLEALPGAVPYQCSGNTLRESFPTGGSSQLARLR